MLEFHADSRASRSRRRNTVAVALKSLGAVGLLATVLLAVYGASRADATEAPATRPAERGGRI